MTTGGDRVTGALAEPAFKFELSCTSLLESYAAFEPACAQLGVHTRPSAGRPRDDKMSIASSLAPSNWGRGWTGGQFSLVRIFIAVLTTAVLVPAVREEPAVTGLLPSGAFHALPELVSRWLAPLTVVMLTKLLLVGYRTRLVSVLLAGLALLWLGCGPLLASPSSVCLSLVLGLLALVPEEPYMSWGATGRLDPRGRWAMPQMVITLAVSIVASAYFNSVVGIPLVSGLGVARLVSRVEVWLVLGMLYACTSEYLRAFVWLCSMLFQLKLALCAFGLSAAGACSADERVRPTLAFVALHLLAFDPLWITALPVHACDRIFYDGECGLCHTFIRFVLAEARPILEEDDDVVERYSLMFSPLQSRAFDAALDRAGEMRANVPDSVVAWAGDDGKLMLRSTAALYVMRRMGGIWRLAGELGMLVPLVLRDRVYDFIASIRHRLFARPPVKDAGCPLLPKTYRRRFDLGDCE